MRDQHAKETLDDRFEGSAEGRHRFGSGGGRGVIASDNPADDEPSRLSLWLVLGQRKAELSPGGAAKGSPQWLPHWRRHAPEWHHLRQLMQRKLRRRVVPDGDRLCIMASV